MAHASRISMHCYHIATRGFEIQEHQILPLHIRSGFLVRGRVWQCNLRLYLCLRGSKSPELGPVQVMHAKDQVDIAFGSAFILFLSRLANAAYNLS